MKIGMAKVATGSCYAGILNWLLTTGYSLLQWPTIGPGWRGSGGDGAFSTDKKFAGALVGGRSIVRLENAVERGRVE